MELVHLVLGACQIKVDSRRFFDFLAPSGIPWFVFCGALVLAQHYFGALTYLVG